MTKYSHISIDAACAAASSSTSPVFTGHRVKTSGGSQVSVQQQFSKSVANPLGFETSTYLCIKCCGGVIAGYQKFFFLPLGFLFGCFEVAVCYWTGSSY